MNMSIIAAQPHVFISMPIGALADAGIGPDDVIEIYVDDNKIIMQRAEPDDDIICDEDCEHCPLRMLDCSNDDSKETVGKG